MIPSYPKYGKEYRSKNNPPEPYRSWLGFDISCRKYNQNSTWEHHCDTLVDEVCGEFLTFQECTRLKRYMHKMYFIPGGRYLYYTGRELKAYNNCFCFKGEEDTREEWARLMSDVANALMLGGGIGVDYSVFRPKGSVLSRTGGEASGPIPLMKIMNEIGRNVMQGGSRRSAGYASLHWKHGDIFEFIHCKDWSDEVKALKATDFNFPAAMDMTNISVNLDDEFFEALENEAHPRYAHAKKVLSEIVESMLTNGEPGVSINCGEEREHTLRNACAEYISDKDSDVCNLGSVNMSRIPTLAIFSDVCYLGAKFLYCGGMKATLPTEKVKETRSQRMAIGVGLMGMHEWMIKKGLPYDMSLCLRTWLSTYQDMTERGARELATNLGTVWPARYRAIAPTGTIGMIAGTTTGIEPLYAVAYRRRYLINDKDWKESIELDPVAKALLDQGIDLCTIETASDLADDPERRISFQADVQEYVDMGISSTLNLPPIDEQSFTPTEFGALLLKYGRRLRGLTTYPDGSRGGQPLTKVSLEEALECAAPTELKDELTESC